VSEPAISVVGLLKAFAILLVFAPLAVRRYRQIAGRLARCPRTWAQRPLSRRPGVTAYTTAVGQATVSGADVVGPAGDYGPVAPMTVLRDRASQAALAARRRLASHAGLAASSMASMATTRSMSRAVSPPLTCEYTSSSTKRHSCRRMLGW
jgi:hypothetical protein